MEQLVLSSNEQIIKKYTYGQVSVTGKGVNNAVTDSLIVTNKRIIRESQGKKIVLRREMPIEAADYIDICYVSQKSSLFATIACFVLAIAGLIAALYTEISWLYAICGAGFVGGIIALIIFILGLRGGVIVIISGRMNESTLMSIGLSNLKVKGGKREIKIKVDRGVALNMVNELGAVLLNVKESLERE